MVHVAATPLAVGGLVTGMITEGEFSAEELAKSLINYRVLIDRNVATNTAVPPSATGIVLVGPSTVSYRTGNQPIDILVDQDDFDEAIKGDHYSAMIRFVYESY